MNYYVMRGGQQYGPHTTEVIRRYLAEGTLSPSDQVREETGQQWATLGQLFPPAPVAPVESTASGAPAQGYSTVQTAPPSLHWALVLLFGFLTCGIFFCIWPFVQARWVRSVDVQSKATLYYVLAMVFAACRITLTAAGAGHVGKSGLALALTLLHLTVGLLCVVFWELGAFNVRRSLLTYYNKVEPIQLWMSGVMTFFFQSVYIQYHLTRIARWKRTGILIPPAAAFPLMWTDR